MMASFAPAQARPYEAPKPRHEPARRAARPRVAPRTRSAPRVAGGVFWIAVVTVLLAGIVALNVAVLRLSVQVEQLDSQRAELAARRDALQTDLSTAVAAGRIEGLAVDRLGLVAPDSTTYLDLKRRHR
jgi:outer membrane murein-binding lipoprotein Lpp